MADASSAPTPFDYLRPILDTALDAVVTMKADGTVESWNSVAEAIFGWTAAEAKGRPMADLIIPPQHRDGHRDGLARYQRTGIAHVLNRRIEITALHRSGMEFPVELTVTEAAEGSEILFIGFLRDISERRAAEEALKESESYVRLLLNSTAEGFYAVDLEGVTTLCNPAFLEMLGFAGANDAVGRKLHDVIHHSHADGSPYPKTDCPIYQCAQSGTPAHVTDEFFYRLDGTRFAVEYWVHPIVQDGVRRGAICTFLDITERRQAEAALLAARADAEVKAAERAAILRQLAEGVIVTDAHGKITFVNEAAARLHGVATLDVGPSEYADTYHLFREDGTPYPPEELPLARAVARGEVVNDARWLIRRPDGTQIVAIGAAQPVMEANGERIGAVLTVRDDTARLAAERALRELNETLEQRVDERTRERDRVWRNSRDLLAIVDRDGVCLDANPAWTSVLGWEREEVVGRHHLALVHPADRRSSRRALATASREGLPNYENRCLHKDGGFRWISWVAAPEEGLIYATGRNVTAEKEAAEELAIAQEALRQSQKMEAVGHLTGGIAHDFNNLLTVVTGNADMARRAMAAGDGSRAERAIGNALKGAERAAILTQRLLAFSRRQPLDPKPIDVGRLIAGMSDLLTRSIGETIQIETVTTAGLWRVEVDPHQLENAILNLAVNARDAMPGGGKLTLEAANTHIDNAYAALHAEVAVGQYVALCCTDTGEGMPREIAEKAFDPFFTTKEVGRGTGLGLSQVYGFVKQSGGHVKIYSEPGQGTTVRLYLPRMAGEVEEDHIPALEELDRGRPGETVLVVEDDDDVRVYTVESLRELGYRVIEAHDGPSALRLLRRQSEPIQLLLTDVVMPEMSGRELADEARRDQPDLKILYTTGYARSAIVHGGRLDPGIDLLLKPFSYEGLAVKVREVLHRDPRDRLLVIAAQDEKRASVSGALATLGFAVDAAATPREALGKVRLGGGSYDAIVVEGVSRGLKSLVANIRAVRSDIPILILAAQAGGNVVAAFGEDRCVAVVPEPHDDGGLQAALARLQVGCSGRADGGRPREG